MNLIELKDRRVDEAVLTAAEKLVAAVTFDDSGAMGRGGNGGLLSRDTIRAADELRALLLRYRAKRSA